MNTALPLEIEDLSFRYRRRETLAIEQVNLVLHPGQVMLIAGASGCGKTTLMRCINGLIPQTYGGEMSGAIRLFGRPVQAMSMAEISQTVGTVLQDPERQILGSYVLNEVAFGLESLGLPRQEILTRVDAALEMLGIQHLRERDTFGLSGGEKQKIALAGVLAMSPKILLLDEPLASLDPASAHEALQVFRRLADQGIAVMVVEHRVEDVLAIQPEVVVYMDAGKVTYHGDSAGLMQVVDYRRIKLPAEVVMARVREEADNGLLNGQTDGNGRAAVNGLYAKHGQADGNGRADSGVAGLRTRLGQTDDGASSPLPLGEGRVRAAGEPLVQFEGVRFRYAPDLPEVLKGVNFEVRRGDVIAILGHNGSGKTTLVKHALGLLKPSRGRVLLDGKDTHHISVAQAAHTIGYVFQSPTQMLFAPTVAEELAFGPRNLGYTPDAVRQNVDWAIETVNLKSELNMPPLALSFGQQKRISIAAVLAMRSRILMMDEPTAGQDYWNYLAFMDGILQIAGTAAPGKAAAQFDAVLFITHDLDLAVIYATRVLLVYDGELVADGPPQEVLADEQRLRACRVLPTSLLELNLKAYPYTGRFLRAETLAQVWR